MTDKVQNQTAAGTCSQQRGETIAEARAGHTVYQSRAAEPTAREMGHLVGMCDGKRHCFFDHALARRMKDAGWIYNDGGDWRISEAGRAVALRGHISNGT